MEFLRSFSKTVNFCLTEGYSTKNAVEFCKGSIDAIRSSLAMSCDVWLSRQLKLTWHTNKQTHKQWSWHYDQCCFPCRCGKNIKVKIHKTYFIELHPIIQLNPGVDILATIYGSVMTMSQDGYLAGSSHRLLSLGHNDQGGIIELRTSKELLKIHQYLLSLFYFWNYKN